ncbi:MAG: hypothetical protein KY468_03790, partial [Armatimonadetes bacterium]|nr:hypothetical protein [Armatimonadota bacterium]
MKRTTPIRFSALTLAGALALSGGSASIALAKPPAKPAAPAKALKVNPAPYTRHLGLIGGNLRDIQAILDARMGENGKKPMTFKVRVAAQMPDSVRMYVLSSSNGLFQGWKFARCGSNVRLYEPISERTTMTANSTVTAKER